MDLFASEQEVIARAEACYAEGADTQALAADHARLLGAYRKLWRQSSRLMCMGDRMQRELSLLNTRLAESEARYRRIFETIGEGLFRARLLPDGGLVLLEVNPAMAAIFGFRTPHVMVRHVRLHDLPEVVTTTMYEVVQTLRTAGRVERMPLSLVPVSGGAVHVEVSATVHEPEQGSAPTTELRCEGLVANVTERVEMERALRTLATTDSLTGLANRRSYLEALRTEVSRAGRTGQCVTVVLLDIDHFKKVNDTYGHDAGDAALVHVAEVLRTGIRTHDVACRYGGEEFALLLTDTTVAEAWLVAERIRTDLGAATIRHGDARLTLTASFGLCCGEPAERAERSAAEDLLLRADEALYAAKREGRDRVVCACGMQRQPHTGKARNQNHDQGHAKCRKNSVNDQTES